MRYAVGRICRSDCRRLLKREKRNREHLHIRIRNIHIWWSVMGRNPIVVTVSGAALLRNAVNRSGSGGRSSGNADVSLFSCALWADRTFVPD